MSRALAYGFGLPIVLVTLLPALRPARSDSYPLSTYPMFASNRERPVLYFAEGLNAKNEAHRLEPALLGTDEVMQATATVRRAVEAGDRAQRNLCKQIAARISEHDEYREVMRVRLVASTYDPISYFTDGPEPLERRVHAQCRVSKKEKKP